MSDTLPASLPPCHGLIRAWRLGRGAPAALDEAGVERAVAAGETGLWLHFDLLDARARSFIAALPGLPETVRTSLTDAEQLVRVEEADNALYGVVPDLHYDQEDPAGTLTGMLEFAVTPGLIVTARRHPLRGVHQALQAPQADSPVEAFATVLLASLAEMTRVVAVLGRRLVEVEDVMLRAHAPGRRGELAAIRRDALRLTRQYGPLREVAEQLREEMPDWADHPALRRALRTTQTALRGLDGLGERARLAQDALNTAAAEEANKRLLVLSVISAAMLPATLVSGIFGMNVGGVPGVPGEGGMEWGFAMALALIVGSVVGTLVSLRLAKML
jgi:zinc transporter